MQKFIGVLTFVHNLLLFAHLVALEAIFRGVPGVAVNEGGVVNLLPSGLAVGRAKAVVRISPAILALDGVESVPTIVGPTGGVGVEIGIIGFDEIAQFHDFAGQRIGFLGGGIFVLSTSA